MRALQPPAARAVASPESVADAADGLDAVGNGAQLPPEAANHDVDRVAATVVTRAPHLAEQVGTRHRRRRVGCEHVQHAELERRQLDASATEIDAAVALIEEWLIALAQLGRGDAVQPPVDGVRSEVERREMERFAADLDRFVKGTEAEREQRVEEGPGVADAEVEPTQVGAQAEVVTLDVEQRRGLNTAGPLARAGGEPAPVSERPLAGRQRVSGGVPGPRCHDWVGSLERWRDVSPLGDDRTPD